MDKKEFERSECRKRKTKIDLELVEEEKQGSKVESSKTESLGHKELSDDRNSWGSLYTNKKNENSSWWTVETGKGIWHRLGVVAVYCCQGLD